MTQHNLEQLMAIAQTRLDNLLKRANQPEEQRRSQDSHAVLLSEAIAEISISLEELNVLVEELQQQNEELIATRQQVDAERQRYLDLFNFAPDGYLVTDVEGVIQEANYIAAQLLNVRHSYLIGKPLTVFVHAEERQNFRKLMLQLQQEGQIRITELHIFHNEDSTDFPAEVTAVIERDRTGKVTGLRWLLRDISDRKQVERKIREQAALIDVATDAIFVHDLENQILFWSQGAERLYGWTTEESLTKKTHELFYKESLLPLEAGLKATIEQGSWQGELEQITKTGREIIVASRLTLVRDESGKPQSILAVNTDITEKKQIEQQFYRSQRLESIGTLASGIAHDLNNVFAPILMIAQLLPSIFKNTDRRNQELFKTIETCAERGAGLVKQILTFAQGTAGKRILLNPGYLLTELLKVISQTFPKSIELRINIPINTLWMVQANPTQLDQVFMNLVVNARDAMPNGGTLTITAENRIIDKIFAQMHLEAKTGGYIVVTISDTGTGIPPEFLERIFDPFFTTKEIGIGTGLGLSTVLGIIKNHDGFVQVSSQIGKGTKFQVFLPTIEGTVSDVTIDQELAQGNGELILIVDGEDVVKQTTQEILEDYNYKTLVANDGIEAITLYAEHKQKISAILLDMLMPNMDGFTAIRILLTLNPKVKIIASSGLSANEQKAIAEGAKKFLLKPYTTTDLLTALSYVIGIRD
ncbi:PAS domain-containing hybrid sensor histidine kinase/response regulator [Anabaena catenula]|uniref:histidine kinase n=1 Tax=Anabaena catenula FACHB-362 TaxID=2692877 RepID=A0ABR8J8U9_9NOST|nr:PAS domain-containing sensor histidine kinase [Anabaena catenula]MBD2694102.1 PAS domain S-box protein [Anabaena catenula FACHB-362]